MSEARYDGARWTIAFVCAIDVLTVAFTAPLSWSFDGFASVATHPFPRVSISVLALAALWRFARDGDARREGWAALLLLALLCEGLAASRGHPERHLFYSGTALFGWLAVASFWDPRQGRLGAVAAISAAYFSAGVSKVFVSGFGWATGYTVLATMTAQQGLIGDGPSAAFVGAALEHRWLAVGLGVMTLGAELAAIAMPFSRVARVAVGFALLGMHLGIALGTSSAEGTIKFVEAQALLLGVVIGPTLLSRDVMSFRTARPMPLAPLAVAAAAALTVMCTQPGQRYADRDDSEQGERRAEPVEGGTPAQSPLRSAIGPLTAGESIGDVAIERLEIRGERVTIATRSSAGPLEFRVECAGAGPTSPFDREGLSVAHGQTDMGWGEMEPIGEALVGALLAEPPPEGGRCAQLRAWMDEATP